MNQPSRKLDIRLILSGILELLGIVGISFGAGLIYLPAGVIVGSIGLIVFGLAIDPPQKPKVVVEE